MCIFFKSKPVQTGPDRSKPVQTGPDVGPVWTGLDRFGICPKNGEINKNMFLHCIKTYFKVVPHVFLDLCFFFFSSQLSANVWTYPFKHFLKDLKGKTVSPVRFRHLASQISGF